jgi:hypothetical protein
MPKARKAPSVCIAMTLGVTILVLSFAPVALAGKGGGGRGGGGGGGSTTGGSGSLTLVMVSDRNANGLPNWGDTIRFNVSASTAEPHVNLTCSQGGVVVYGASTGYYASYPWPWTQNMTLSSTNWSGGAAACTATLQAYSGTSVSTLGTLSFSVAA